MNEGEILTIVNQVIGHKTEVLEIIESGMVVEVVVSNNVTISPNDVFQFTVRGLEFVRKTTAYRFVENQEVSGMLVSPCLMFRILEVGQ